MKVFKRSLFILAALFLFAVIIPATSIPAAAAEIVESGTCGENLTWTLDSEGVLTISGKGEMYDYGHGDSSKYAPWHSSSVSSAVIKEGVTSIGDWAFFYVDQMTSIEIADSVTSIGSHAFEGCLSLTSIEIPDSVSCIEECAFSFCRNLTSVELPDSLTEVTESAFVGCEGLTSVTLSKGVTSIDEDAFQQCDGMENIYVDEENPVYSSIDGILYNKEKTCVLYCPRGRTGSVAIPEGVTEIGEDAFYTCKNLEAVTIPEGVTVIGFDAFCGCSGLTSVEIPDSVTNIASGSFWGSGLISVTISKNVTWIGNAAFGSCANLEEIIVDPENPNYSSVDGAVYNKEQTRLEAYPGAASGNIRVLDGVKHIGSDAFDGCKRIETITVHESVESIEYGVFQDCTGLKHIIFEGSAPLIGKNVFYGTTLTACYPEDDPTWTDIVNREFSYSKITWKPYKPGTDPTAYTLEITTQPKTQYAQLGEKAKFTVKAEGEGLKYQWYYKDVDGTKYKKCSGTKATYSLEMTEARKDRKLYCIITDASGNEVKSKTVTMKMAASIKTQPKTQYTELGEKAKFTVKAVGDGLTYQWYYKSAGSSKYKKASCTKSSYTITMTEDRKDRKFYCVITDKYGNEVKSKTVTMKLAASIKTDPKSVKTSIGKKATFTVKAVGDGLKYQWYYKDTDSSKYKKASCTKATYSIELTKARNGRKFYCVITDKYGNTVKTKTVSMKKK